MSNQSFNAPAWGWPKWGSWSGDWGFVKQNPLPSLQPTKKEEPNTKLLNETSRVTDRVIQSLLTDLATDRETQSLLTDLARVTGAHQELSDPAIITSEPSAGPGQPVTEPRVIEERVTFTVPADMSRKIETYKITESLLNDIYGQVTGLISELENLENLEYNRSHDHYIDPLQEERCLYKINTFKDEILKNDFFKQFIFDSIKSALKDDSLTLETLSDFLKENPLVMIKSVITSDGMPLFKKIGEIVEEKTGSLKGITILIDTLMALLKQPSKSTLLRKSIEAILQHHHLKSTISALSLETIPDKVDFSNPLEAIKKNPSILLHSPDPQSKCTLIKALEKTMEEHTLSFDQDKPIQFLSREDNESMEVFNTRLTIHQLAQFDWALRNSNDMKPVYNYFKTLPVSIQQHLSEIVWSIDQHVTEDFNFGKYTIENNPYILSKIRSSDNKNIIQQMIEVLEHKAIFMRAFEIVDKHCDSPNKEDLIQEFSELSPINEVFAQIHHSISEFTGSEEELKTLVIKTKEDFEKRIKDCLVDRLINPEEICTNPQYKLAELCQRIDTFKNDIKVAMISPEYKGLAAVGGLAEALKGMTESLNGDSRPTSLPEAKVIAILPKYSDEVIPSELSAQFEDQSPLYTLSNQKGVYKAYIGNVLCLFIDDDRFAIPLGESVYFSSELSTEVHRFLQFQKLAAELSIKLYQDRLINVIHCHDSQTGLIPYIIKKSKRSAERPACVFTTHNNLHQFCFTPVMLKKVNLTELIKGDRLINSFSLAFAHADACTTVSEQFAKEAMSTGVLGRGVHKSVISSAFRGKFFSILNGNSVTWNPKTNTVMAQWADIATVDDRDPSITYELIANAGANNINKDSEDQDVVAWINEQSRLIAKAAQENNPITYDLTYSFEDHPLIIQFKKQLCKMQIALYFEKYQLGNIDPSKPLLLNIGRLDPYQKGLDKLPAAMEMVKNLDAQMIVIGLGGESCPKHMDAIQSVCQRYNNDGLVLIQDQKGEGGKIKWQQGHTDSSGHKIPGMGPILRAAADIGFFPSEYEPCGLVQGESFLFGSLVVATKTGGFVDTVFKQESREHNGWLFDRMKDWASEDQAAAMEEPLRMAINYVRERTMSTAEGSRDERTVEFGRQLQRIMESALNMGWNQTQDRSKRIPGSEKLLAVYKSAINSKTAQDRVIHFDYAELEKKVEVLETSEH